MTTNDQNLRASFEDFDQPVQPPARLEKQIQFASAFDDSRPGFRTGLAVAAAVLMVFVAAVIALRTIGPATSEPELASQSIPAAVASSPVASIGEQPVMFGGSAAQDGSYPGGAPPMGSLQELWSADEAANGDSHFFGDALYIAGYPTWNGDKPETTTTLTAYDAATGDIRWQVPISASQQIAIDGHGIYASIPAMATVENAGTLWTMGSESDVPGWQIALLDAATGQPIWRSSQVVPDQGGRGVLSWIVISDGFALYQPAVGSLTALDAATGKQRWTYSSPVDQRISCVDYACSLSPAVADGVVYIGDLGRNQIVAITLTAGDVQWVAPYLSDDKFASLTSATQPAVNLVLAATELGAVVGTDVVSENSSPESSFRLLDRTTGSAIWDRNLESFAFPILIVDGSILTTRIEDSGPVLQYVDLATGVDQAGPVALDADSPNNWIYLPLASAFLQGTRSSMGDPSLLQRIPVIGRLFGEPDQKATISLLDGETLANAGEATFKNCYVETAVSADGKIICQDTDGSGFAIYGSPNP